MADFQTVTPGEPFTETADFRNAVVEVLRAFYAGKRIFGDERQAIPLQKPTPVTILNSSGGKLKQFSIVGLGDPLNDPTENEDEFRSRVAFESAAPAADEPFAILLEPVPDGAPAPAVLAGPVQCLVQFTKLTDKWASPIADDYNKLLASSGGVTRILWAGLPAATQLDGSIDNVVTSLVVDAAAPIWPDPGVEGDFIVTIDSEDLLVTAINKTTWTVTRAQNGTTASGHANDSAVTFKSGIVWAIVLLTQKPATAPVAITQINTDATVHQTLSIGTSGTDFAIVHNGTGDHKFNLPDASPTARGVVTTGTQAFAGFKGFTNSIEVGLVAYFDTGMFCTIGNGTPARFSQNWANTPDYALTIALVSDVQYSGPGIADHGRNSSHVINVRSVPTGGSSYSNIALCLFPPGCWSGKGAICALTAWSGNWDGADFSSVFVPTQIAYAIQTPSKGIVIGQSGTDSIGNVFAGGIWAGNTGTPPPITPPVVILNTNLTLRAINAANLNITGSGIDPTFGNDSITFTTLGATATVDDTPPTATTATVTFTTPPNANGWLLAKITVSGTDSAIVPVAIIVSAPTVTNTTTVIGPGAQVITVTGTGFDPGAAGNTITFTTLGPPTGTIQSVTAAGTSMTVLITAPTGTGTLSCKVNSYGGDSNTTGVAVVTGATPGPVVYLTTTAITLAATIVTITGDNFDVTLGNNTVVLSGGATGTVVGASTTTLWVSVSGLVAGILTAVVTTNTLTSGAPVQVATVGAGPTITLNMAPRADNAPFIIIRGTGFDTSLGSVNSVALSSGTVASISVDSSTQIMVTFGTQPSATPLTAVVTVNGVASSSVQIATLVTVTVTMSAANISVGAASIAIAGTNFEPGATVFLLHDGTIAARAVNIFGTRLVRGFVTPPSTLGAITAVVNSYGGSSGAPVQVGTVVSSIANPVVLGSQQNGVATMASNLNVNIAADGLLIISVAFCDPTGSGAGDPGTIAATVAGVPMTLRASYPLQTSTDGKVAIFTAMVTPTGTTALVITSSNSVSNQITVSLVTGVIGSADQGASAHGGATTPDTGTTASTAVANELAFCAFLISDLDGLCNNSWQNGFTEDFQLTFGVGGVIWYHLQTAYKILSVTGTVDGSVSGGATPIEWAGVVVTVG